MIYLDNAATTPVHREVLEAMWPYFTGEFGNPSSHHALGSTARDALTDARRRVATVLGCRGVEIIFTSGGTEADNLALKGIALAHPRGRHIVTSSIEHEAVLASCDYLHRHHGFTVTHLPVDATGTIDPEDFRQALQPGTTLCSILLANNEVGTVQPIAQLAAIARQHGVPMHTDAVQAAGQLPLAVTQLGADAISLSGHKLGAPKGIGVLYLRSRIDVEPVLHGGGQERGRRSGTENVAAAIGFARALELSEAGREARALHLCTLRDRLIAGVLSSVEGAVLTGHPVHRLPNLASFCLPGRNGEAILLELAERGVICSSGSACAAGSDEPSHVLLALGLSPAVARTALRFSLHDALSESDIDRTISAVVSSCRAVDSLEILNAQSKLCD